jgi:hypothetical protein
MYYGTLAHWRDGRAAIPSGEQHGACQADADGERQCAVRRRDRRGVGDADEGQARGGDALRVPARQRCRGGGRAGDHGQAEGQERQRGHQRAAATRVPQVQRDQGQGRAGGQGVQQSAERTLTQRALTEQEARQQRGA